MTASRVAHAAALAEARALRRARMRRSPIPHSRRRPLMGMHPSAVAVAAAPEAERKKTDGFRRVPGGSGVKDFDAAGSLCYSLQLFRLGDVFTEPVRLSGAVIVG